MDYSYKTSILDLRGLQIIQNNNNSSSNRDDVISSSNHDDDTKQEECMRIKITFFCSDDDPNNSHHNNSPIHTIYSLPMYAHNENKTFEFGKSCIILPQLQSQSSQPGGGGLVPSSICNTPISSMSGTNNTPIISVSSEHSNSYSMFHVKFELELCTAMNQDVREFVLGSSLLHLDDANANAVDTIVVLPVLQQKEVAASIVTPDRVNNVSVAKTKSGRWKEVKSKTMKRIRSMLLKSGSEKEFCPVSFEPGSTVRLQVKKVYNNGARTPSAYFDKLRELSAVAAGNAVQLQSSYGDDYDVRTCADDVDQEMVMSTSRSSNGSNSHTGMQRESSYSSSPVMSLLESIHGSIHGILTSSVLCGGSDQVDSSNDTYFCDIANNSTDGSAYCGSEEEWDWYAEQDNVSMLTDPTMEIKPTQTNPYVYVTPPRR